MTTVGYWFNDFQRDEELPDRVIYSPFQKSVGTHINYKNDWKLNWKANGIRIRHLQMIVSLLIFRGVSFHLYYRGHFVAWYQWVYDIRKWIYHAIWFVIPPTFHGWPVRNWLKKLHGLILNDHRMKVHTIIEMAYIFYIILHIHLFCSYWMPLFCSPSYSKWQAIY